MIYAVLAVLGLIFGSFVNALVYRVHEQSKKSGAKKKELSIIRGRSMCIHCKHELAWYDLLPVFSWLALKGRCRYCHKPIHWQYPAVEVMVALLFVLSYVFWPESEVVGAGLLADINFMTWLLLAVGFAALAVYDLRWMMLPNRIIYPLLALAGTIAAVNLMADFSSSAVYMLLFSVVIGGGIFWFLFQISDGKWIGGGDVKLGALSGLVLADPYQAFMMLLTASVLGSIAVVPGLATKKLKATSRIPFGPFLIVSIVIVKLFGQAAIEWYKRSLGF